MRQLRVQNGFSLIELMVTIVIFSVGLLGVAGLQIVSKRATFEAMQRSTASQIAFGLLEDMRANGPALASYLAIGQVGQNSITSTTATTVSTCADMAAPCNSVDIAARDLSHWEIMLDGGMEAGPNGGAGGLVSPAACITGPPFAVAGIYTVSVVWRGTAAIADPGINACGATSGQYGAGNVFRRVVQIPTFIDPAI